ncbi:MAG: 4Fe-4S dicluster domain-containing protein [Desulfobacteraceae bacterium]|nr:4Fe-4S dicluster domain-containing protein [Desulfobacteraceae bacterium]
MSISRRTFLSWLGAAGAGTLLPLKGHAAGNRQFDGYPESMGVLHDTTFCIGCRSCENACNRVNEFPAPGVPFSDLSVLEKYRRTTSKTYTVVNRFDVKGKAGDQPGTPVFVKKQCNHCLEPACASACFVKAFKKTKEGPVTYDASVCVGCRYCMIACPFEIPSYEYDEPFTPRVMKCTLCHPRLMEGLVPGCVEVCPTEALTFGKRENLLTIARKRIQEYPDRYVSHIYGEHEMGGTSWLYLSGVPFTEISMREDLGNISAPMLTSGALSMVPMIAGLWPVLLAGIYAMTLGNQKQYDLEKNMAVKSSVEKAESHAKEVLAQALEKAKKAQQDAVKREVDKAAKAIHQTTAEGE